MKKLLVLALATFLVLLTGCPSPVGNDGDGGSGGPPVVEPVDPTEPVVENPYPIHEQVVSYKTEDITLAWDDSEGSAEKYILYCRKMGTTEWTKLGETTELTYTIVAGTLDYGRWEFGVEAVAGGLVSERVSSLDETAYPPNGWFIFIAD